MACQLTGLAETTAIIGRILEDGSIDFSSLYEDECLAWGNNTPDHHAHGKHTFSRRSNRRPGVIGSVFAFEQSMRHSRVVWGPVRRCRVGNAGISNHAAGGGGGLGKVACVRIVAPSETAADGFWTS